MASGRRHSPQHVPGSSGLGRDERGAIPRLAGSPHLGRPLREIPAAAPARGRRRLDRAVQPDPRQNSSELNLAPTPVTIPHAGTAHRGRPRTHVGASWPPGAGVGEPGAAANNWPPTTERRDAVSGRAIDCFGSGWRRAGGTGVQRWYSFNPTRRTLASRLVAPAMDSAFETSIERPSLDRSADPLARFKRWPQRIRYGERRGFMVSCVRTADRRVSAGPAACPGTVRLRTQLISSTDPVRADRLSIGPNLTHQPHTSVPDCPAERHRLSFGERHPCPRSGEPRGGRAAGRTTSADSR